MREQLLGHLLGALEDSEQEQVDVRLRSDPELRSELAVLRGRLQHLEAGRYEFAPPPGLAERTCRAVAAERESAAAARRRPMSPAAVLPGDSGRFRWADLVLAAAIVLVISLLLFPAIQSSRFNAQLVACQGNLGQIGLGMNGYTELHGGHFPSMSSPDNPAMAGILYVPILLRDGFLSNDRCFICPAAPSAHQEQSRIVLSAARAATQDGLDDLLRWVNESYGFHLGYVRDGVYCGTKNLGRSYFALGSDVPGNDPSNGRQSPNHGGFGQNVLFESGAVRFVTSSRPFPQADDFYANQLGLVAPGVDVNDSVIARLVGLPLRH